MQLIKKIAVGIFLVIIGVVYNILFNGGIFGVLDILLKLVLIILVFGVIGGISVLYNKIKK